MSRVRCVVRFLLLALVAIAGALIMVAIFGTGYRKFVVGNTASMSPTINSGELLFVKPFDPKLHILMRYQIIVFHSALQGLPNEDRVMRVLGLPGERVKFLTNSVLINGFNLAEAELPAVLRDKQWLSGQGLESSHQSEWALGPDEVFVIGDNLGAALDSRYWGPLSLNDVFGVVDKKSKGKQVQILNPALFMRSTITIQDGEAEPADIGK